MESPPAFRRDPTDLSASNHTRGFSGKSRALAVLVQPLRQESTLLCFLCFFVAVHLNEWYKAAQREDNQMMNFIWWLIVGLIAGALARLIMPGRDPMGIIATIVLGIIGSIVGGLVSMAIWPSRTAGFQPAGLLLSILGAIVVLFIWRMIKSRNTV
jgi:uncharacterized membrane protein YeaQ/YmgE (transglycosylase-associated protein family)